MSTRLLDTLGDSYIVCGRGQRKYNSNGNKTLRNIVVQYLSIYINKNTSRISKSKLVDRATKEIFGMGMVFVKLAKNTHTWETLSYAQARDKVAHRFRDAARQVYPGNEELSSPKPVSPAGSDLDDCTASSDISLSTLSSTINLPSSQEEDQNKKKARSALHDSSVDSETLCVIKNEIEVLISKIDNNKKEEEGNLRKEEYLSAVPPPTNSLTSLISNADLNAAPQQQEGATYFEDDDMINMLLTRHHLIADEPKVTEEDAIMARFLVEEIDERTAIRSGGFLPGILFDGEFTYAGV